jgi:hypothetical protein
LGSTVTDVNGQGYLKYTGYPEYYQLWRSFDGTNFTDPVTTTATGYLGAGNGFIADGHVSQTFPDNGAVSVAEVGGQRQLFASDKFGDVNLFTSRAGSNGPFAQEGILIENGVTGSPTTTITSAARSGTALPVTLAGPTHRVLTMYVDGNLTGAMDDPSGWAVFDGQPDPRSSHDHDIFYAPITITFNQLVGPIDFGDAPDDATVPIYPTLLANNGARHGIISGFHLGAGVDAEADGQPDATATGDGNDDEDGVAIARMAQGRNTTVQVTVAGADLFGDTAKLDAWVDFDGSGTFDAGERITAGGGTSVVNGVNHVTFAVPAGAELGNTFARFRLSSAGGLNPNGEALDGEVEDYQVTIAEPPSTVYVNETWAGSTVGQDPDGGGPATEFGYDAFDNLAEGVAMVAADGTVDVAAGTYVHTGQLDINRAMTIVGAGRDVTLVQRDGEATGKEQRAIQINADNVTIESLSLAGWSDVTTEPNKGLKYLAWNVADSTTFNDVHFAADYNRAGIYTDSQDGLTVTNSHFIGTLYRPAIRGGGEHMLISGNSFEQDQVFNGFGVTSEWYSSIFIEYTLADHATAGQMQFTGSTFEDVTFTSPTVSLTITGGDQADIITVASVDSSYRASLIISGGGAADVIDLNTNLSLGSATSAGNLTLTAETLDIDGAVTSIATDASTNAGTVTFNGPVTPHAALAIDTYDLTVASSAVTTITAGIGGSTGNVDIAATTRTDVDGAIALSGAGNIVQDRAVISGVNVSTTSGDVTFDGPATLDTGAVEVSTGDAGGDILFNSTLNGGQALTLIAGTGNITATGAVGGTSAVGSITVNSAVDVMFSSAVRTTGHVTQVAGTGTTTFHGTSGTGIGGNLSVTTHAIAFDSATVTTVGTVNLNAQNAISVNAGAGLNAESSTITIAANQDANGAEGFAQADNTRVQTTNGTAAAINLTVGGSGNAAIAPRCRPVLPGTRPSRLVERLPTRATRMRKPRPEPR